MVRPEGDGRRSGDDVGQKLAFEAGNLILEAELALLEPLDQELVGRAGLADLGDDQVKITMFRLQTNEFPLQGIVVRNHAIERICEPR